jgi:EmrB/QacA subfamily drug resistance transporter
VNRAAVADSGAIDPRIWKVAWVVLLGPLMTSLDSTVVNVSLSRLGRDLRVPLTRIQWVISGYLLALALMLPLSGWLVDRFGAKRVYLGCFILFTAASVACGLAPNAGALIAGRVLQGVAGGLLAPMAQMMIVRGAGRHVARVMGIMVMPILLGPLAGPVLAGVILQHASWRWIFFINLPIGLLALILAQWILPADHDQVRPRPFDLTGFLLLSPGLVLVLHSLESLSGHARGRGPYGLELVSGIALLAIFLAHARRKGPTALIEIALFRLPPFNAAALTQFLTNALAYGGQMMVPMYLLVVLGVSPTRAGLLMLPAGLGMLVAFPLMGAMVERFGSRQVAASGALLALAGTVPFAWQGFPAAPFWCLSLALAARGAGLGAIGIPSIAAAYHGLDKARIPVATTTINIVQRLGGPVATTGLVIFLHMVLGGLGLDGSGLGPAQTLARSQAFATTFRLLALLHAAAFLAALRLPHRAVADAKAAG